jgi:hypothetical protein
LITATLTGCEISTFIPFLVGIPGVFLALYLSDRLTKPEGPCGPGGGGCLGLLSTLIFFVVLALYGLIVYLVALLVGVDIS